MVDHIVGLRRFKVQGDPTPAVGCGLSAVGCGLSAVGCLLWAVSCGKASAIRNQEVGQRCLYAAVKPLCSIEQTCEEFHNAERAMSPQVNL